jgi:hypothetical protein
MSETNERYIAVLQGIENGEPVTYGEEFFDTANEIQAKAEAGHWAANLHRKVGKKATLVLKKGNRGVHSEEFEAI